MDTQLTDSSILGVGLPKKIANKGTDFAFDFRLGSFSTDKRPSNID